MSTILGVNSGREKKIADEFAEKFAGNFPKARQTKLERGRGVTERRGAVLRTSQQFSALS